MTDATDSEPLTTLFDALVDEIGRREAAGETSNIDLILVADAPQDVAGPLTSAFVDRPAAERSVVEALNRLWGRLVPGSGGEVGARVRWVTRRVGAVDYELSEAVASAAITPQVIGVDVVATTLRAEGWEVSVIDGRLSAHLDDLFVDVQIRPIDAVVAARARTIARPVRGKSADEPRTTAEGSDTGIGPHGMPDGEGG